MGEPRVIVKTGRFGSLEVIDEEKIKIPQGIFGFPEYTEFCLVDPGDDTLILWLQSLQNPDLVIPVLEPKVFKPDYVVRLSAAELRELKLDKVSQAAVLSLLTIPDDVAQMTANLRAPIVINLKDQLAKQVVLQENEYSIKHPMFKELRAHLLTIEAAQRGSVISKPAEEEKRGLVRVGSLPPSAAVRTLLSS